MSGNTKHWINSSYKKSANIKLNTGGKLTAEERILDAGYEDVVYLTNYSYDSALIVIPHALCEHIVDICEKQQ